MLVSSFSQHHISFVIDNYSQLIDLLWSWIETVVKFSLPVVCLCFQDGEWTVSEELKGYAHRTPDCFPSAKNREKLETQSTEDQAYSFASFISNIKFNICVCVCVY